MRQIVLVSTALLALAIALPTAAAESGEVPWITDISGAIADARDGNMPVMVDVWAIWCKPCLELDETTYRDAEVVDVSRRFVPLKVDADVHENFIERYAVDAYPTILFLDGEGREVTRLMGLVTTQQILSTMRAVAEGYTAYVTSRDAELDLDSLSMTRSYLVDVDNPLLAVDLLRKAAKKAKTLPAAERERIELWIADTRCVADGPKAAQSGFQKLADRASDAEVKGLALAGLARVWAERGKQEQADELRARVENEFPDAASENTELYCLNE
ncbi:MAG: thioredoxin fold domain-containing protein [bacterium]|nr:thioredoxin fold domain-containing protein [bacterium]